MTKNRAKVALTLWALASTGFSTTAFAGEIHEFYRGARALGMGNAFVAVADDEQAVFLNPAGLAGNSKYSLNLAAVDLTASTDVAMSLYSGLEAATALEGDITDAVLGKNILAQSQIVSTLMMPNLGVAVLVDGQTALLGRNKALPQLTLGYQVTNGIQVAYGVSVNRGARKRSEFRLGIGGKVLWRRGGWYEISTLQLLNMSRSYIGELVGGFDRAIGADVGAQYLYKPSKRFTLSTGLVYTDIGDTTFGKKQAAIKGNLAAGLAAQYTFGRMRFTASYDYKHILDQTDWRKKNHFGLEASLPLISLYGGIDQVFLTYGATIDLWLFRITAVSYGEEFGSFVYQNPVRRWTLSACVKFAI